MEYNYEITYQTYKQPKESDFQQHFHNHTEIYIFIEGSASYEVEATSYTLEPYDIIIIPKNKLHGLKHKESKKYSRIVLWINDEFFEEMNCPEYKQILFKNNGYKIPGFITDVSGLRDVLNNLKNYSNNFESCYTKISEACLIMFLHILNNINESRMPEIRNNNIQNIISYINHEFKNDITLDELSEKFYISKYHLCREFKKLTGYTIHEYTNIKKFQKTKELCEAGMNIGNACIQAGFNSYSSFYRYYRKRFSNTPGEWLSAVRLEHNMP